MTRGRQSKAEEAAGSSIDAGEPADGGGRRVALFYGDYPPKPKGLADGGADFVQRLGEGLAMRGFEVTAIVSRREGRSAPYLQNGVLVAPVVSGWRLRDALGGSLAEVRRVLATRRVEVNHVVYPDPYLRYGPDSYHLPFLLRPSTGRPLLVTLFGFAVTGAGLVTRLGLGSLFASADRLVITDADLLRLFRRRLPFWAGKAEGGFVGSIAGVGSPRWSAAELAGRKLELGLTPDERHLGFFGFWGPDKGLEELIEAVAKLRAAGERVKLVLVGGRESELKTDYERSIRVRVEAAGIAAAVVETGPLSEAEVARYLVAMDACVLPFRTNPLGRSSLAVALTLGVPTVVTRPAADDRLLVGMPLLEDPSADRIAAAVRSVLESPSSQQRYAEASAAAASHWSWDSIVGQYAGLYRRLARR